MCEATGPVEYICQPHESQEPLTPYTLDHSALEAWIGDRGQSASSFARGAWQGKWALFDKRSVSAGSPEMI